MSNDEAHVRISPYEDQKICLHATKSSNLAEIMGLESPGLLHGSVSYYN